VQLVSKISNLCGPDPPTSQRDRETDGQTDNIMRSQYRAMHYSASRGKKEDAEAKTDQRKVPTKSVKSVKYVRYQLRTIIVL